MKKLMNKRKMIVLLSAMLISSDLLAPWRPFGGALQRAEQTTEKAISKGVQTAVGAVKQAVGTPIGRLFIAVQTGIEPGAAEILKNHPEIVNNQDSLGNTPLFYIIAQPMADLLLSYGAKADIPNKKGETALFHLVKNAKHKAVDSILNKYPELVNSTDSLGNTPLFDVIAKPMTDVLLSHGARADIPNKNGDTALFHLVKNKKPFAVDSILTKYPALVDSRNVSGNTPLFYVQNAPLLKGITGGASLDITITPMTYILFKHNANLNVQNNDGQTPLDIAVTTGNALLVDLFLASGANPTIADKLGLTPLHYLTVPPKPSPEMAAAGAMIKGAMVAAMCLSFPLSIAATALIFEFLTAASILNRNGIAVLLLTKGPNGVNANVNAQDTSGNTPLHFLAAGMPGKGQTGIILAKTLITHGADIHITNTNGQTAYDLAQQNNRSAALLSLLRTTTAPKKKLTWEDIGRGLQNLGTKIEHAVDTPTGRLFLAVHAGPAAQQIVIGILNLHPEIVNNQDDKGNTPLFYVWGAPMANILLNYGAKADIPNKNGDTAIIHLVRGKKPEAVDSILTKYPTLVDSRDASGNTPLFFVQDAPLLKAVTFGASFDLIAKMTTILHKHNANLNAQNNDGQTPLDAAVIMGNDGLVAQFLDWGATPTIADKLGLTPLHYLTIQPQQSSGASLAGGVARGQVALAVVQMAARAKGGLFSSCTGSERHYYWKHDGN